MLPEMELFQYIYKTADMGCQGIDTVEEHAEKRLREELRRERQEYQTIRDEADGYIRQRGDTPAGVGTMARVSAEWMVHPVCPRPGWIHHQDLCPDG